MSTYLRDNLWRSFHVGAESFLLLGKLYSYSATPQLVELHEESRFRGFLYSYAIEESPEYSPEGSYEELLQWFERDWLSTEYADKLMRGEFSAFGNGSLSLLKHNEPRGVLSALIFQPQLLQANWVRRLWRETFIAQGENYMATELELIFLCNS